MITHFRELQIQTVSIEGVKQVYADRLGMPIVSETDSRIAFALTPHVTLAFVEANEPIAPAHFAIQVAASKIEEAYQSLKQAGLITLKRNADGEELGVWNGRSNVYFRDGDGNLLELIAHDYVQDDSWHTSGPLHALYLREVGLPVPNVKAFREMLNTLGMITDLGPTAEDLEDEEIFRFVIGGTAHAVVVRQDRRWIPINMQALAPKLQVTFGTPDPTFLEQAAQLLEKCGERVQHTEQQISFTCDGYAFSLVHTPEFTADMVTGLNLPFIKK